jgi:hypothetical protein
MSLRKIVQHIAQARGILLEEPRPGERDTLFRFQVPSQRGWLDLDEQIPMLSRGPNWQSIVALIDKLVTDSQRALFRKTVDHIAKHDREPLDRVAALELHARKLLEALGDRPYDGSPLAHAVCELERVVNAKPGAASWGRDGYGKDPG